MDRSFCLLLYLQRLEKVSLAFHRIDILVLISRQYVNMNRTRAEVGCSHSTSNP